MRFLKVLTVAAFVLITILIFQTGPHQGSPKYNTATEVKVEGVVQDIQQYWCSISGEKGTHLMLKAGSDVLEIHLAPDRYLRGNGITFSPNDHLTVIGSIVMYQGHDAMIAREVTRGAETFAMRRIDGAPMWVESYAPYVR